MSRDGFHLVYDRIGTGPAVVLLHGWPGDRTDYAEVVRALAGSADVVVPDLRGFGESDKHDVDPAEQYGVGGQARSVIGLIEDLGLDRPVIGGYDIGSRDRADGRPVPTRPRARSGPHAAAARRRRTGSQRGHATGVLVPDVSPARPR